MIGDLAGLSGAAVWAVVSTTMRAASEKTSAVTVNWLRCSFATVTLGLLVVAFGRLPDLRTLPLDGLSAILISGMLGQAMGDGLLLQSMKTIGASRALPVSGTSPIFTMAMASLLLGERVTWVAITGTLLVMGGIYLLAFPHGVASPSGNGLRSSDRRGIMIAASAALCYAASTVILKAGISHMDLVVASFFRMAMASLSLFVVEARTFGTSLPVGLGRRAFGLVVMAGVLNSASSLLYVTAVSYAGAAKASVLASTTPLFALPISIFLLRERINSRVVAGTILAILGIWMVVLG